ncbi:MAG TPA: FecR domain-containing protein [Longimicrobiales bacterium]
MSPEELDRLIARYVAGEAAPDEVARLEALMAADETIAKEVDALRRAWQAAGAVRSPWDSRVAWKSVRARLVPPSSGDAGRVRPWVVDGGGRPASGGRLRRAAWLLGRVAAVLLVVAGGVWGVVEWTAGGGVPEPLNRVATERAQVGPVYLSDGTRVLLGAESELRFAPSLGARSRDVYLDGNAYFEVKTDPRRPFRVHTAQGVVEVLGTRFGVRAYGADSMTTVVVAEGRVRLDHVTPDDVGDGRRPGRAAAERNAVVLESGDLGRVTARGEIEKQRGVAVDRYLAWTERRLVFTDTPLREIAAELQRWYDVEITISEESLGRRRLSATFGHEPLDAVLNHLAIALGARVVREGRTVTFQSR